MGAAERVVPERLVPERILPGRRRLDFALRVAFFALAPFALVPAASLFPLGGAFASVGLALVACLASEAVRARAGSSRLHAFFARRLLGLDTYYRENPPKPFLYYVFYALFFPYWIFKKDARREFFLYKTFNLAGLALMAGVAVVRYERSYAPELGFREFLPMLGLTLLFESAIVLAFAMPIATTVVALHHARQTRKLALLVVLALASLALASVPVLRRHDPIVSLETRARLFARTAKDRPRAKAALLAALRAAWQVQDKSPSRAFGDGKLEGAPLDAARASLEAFYREDEAAAFDLWASPRKKPQLLVLYTEGRPGRDPIWVGVKGSGEVVRDPNLLPSGAFAAMRHAIR